MSPRSRVPSSSHPPHPLTSWAAGLSSRGQQRHKSGAFPDRTLSQAGARRQDWPASDFWSAAHLLAALPGDIEHVEFSKLWAGKVAGHLLGTSFGPNTEPSTGSAVPPSMKGMPWKPLNASRQAVGTEISGILEGAADMDAMGQRDSERPPLPTLL